MSCGGCRVGGSSRERRKGRGHVQRRAGGWPTASAAHFSAIALLFCSLAFSYSSLKRSSCASPASCASTCGIRVHQAAGRRCRVGTHCGVPMLAGRHCWHATIPGNSSATISMQLHHAGPLGSCWLCPARSNIGGGGGGTAAAHLLEPQLDAGIGLAALRRRGLLLGVLLLHPGAGWEFPGAAAQVNSRKGSFWGTLAAVSDASDSRRGVRSNESPNEARNWQHNGGASRAAAAAGPKFGTDQTSDAMLAILRCRRTV